MADETQTESTSESTHSAQMAETTLGKFLEAGSVRAVYGDPLQYGDITIIPAAEVVSVIGFGIGAGAGQSGEGNASGAGGGGGIQSRPVAAVVISPNGVRIQPIVDVTKIWLAGLTALGFIFGAMRRMRRGS